MLGKKQALIKFVKENRAELEDILETYRFLIETKLFLLDILKESISMFDKIIDENGNESEDEGYVLITPEQTFKIINRIEFTKKNRARNRNNKQ